MANESDEYDSNYDWEEAFKYGVLRACVGRVRLFALDDVATIDRRVTGANDEVDWLATGKLKDGRTFSLRAGCDNTGWGCSAGGDGAIDDPSFFTVDEQLRLERDGKPGFWPGAFCDIHSDCREHTEMARECRAKRDNG